MHEVECQRKCINIIFYIDIAIILSQFNVTVFCPTLQAQSTTPIIYLHTHIVLAFTVGFQTFSQGPTYIPVLCVYVSINPGSGAKDKEGAGRRTHDGGTDVGRRVRRTPPERTIPRPGGRPRRERHPLHRRRKPPPPPGRRPTSLRSLLVTTQSPTVGWGAENEIYEL